MSTHWTDSQLGTAESDEAVAYDQSVLCWECPGRTAFLIREFLGQAGGRCPTPGRVIWNGSSIGLLLLGGAVLVVRDVRSPGGRLR